MLLHFRHLDITHRKYSVLLSTVPKTQFFLINRQFNGLGLEGDALVERQENHIILQREPRYRFFHQDSWLDCTMIHGNGTIEELENTIRQDPTSVCCSLLEQDRDVMLDIIRDSRMISQIKKDWILDAFNGR